MKAFHLLVVLIGILMVAGCSSRVDNARIAKLENDVASLKVQVKALRAQKDATPPNPFTPGAIGNEQDDFAKGNESTSPGGSSNANESKLDSDAVRVGSIKSDKFHLMSCRSTIRIKPENIVFYKSRDEAIAAGKIPCLVCDP